ncbi:MAG: PP2C family protein-serine/threonine phosphatase [Planctomycetota bacterium]
MDSHVTEVGGTREGEAEGLKLTPFRLASSYLPHDRVGGDFFQVVPIDKHHSGIVVGDVSGHGLEAALLMGMARRIFGKHCIAGGIDPAAVLRKANEDLVPKLGRCSFVTVLYGILEHSTGRMHLARAGHCPPILVPASGAPFVISSGGIALGIDAGALFVDALEVEEIQLEKGGRLILYSDGLVQACHPQRGPYGVERVLKALRATPSRASAQQVLDILLEDLKRFLDGPAYQDDLTLVCLEHPADP